MTIGNMAVGHLHNINVLIPWAKGARTRFKLWTHNRPPLRLLIVVIVISMTVDLTESKGSNSSLISQGFTEDFQDQVVDFCKQDDKNCGKFFSPEWSGHDDGDSASFSIDDSRHSRKLDTTLKSSSSSSSFTFLNRVYSVNSCPAHTFPSNLRGRDAPLPSSLSKSSPFVSKTLTLTQDAEHQETEMEHQLGDPIEVEMLANSHTSEFESENIEDVEMNKHRYDAIDENGVILPPMGISDDVVDYGDEGDDDDVSAWREVISYRSSVPLLDPTHDIYLDLHLHLDAYVEFHEQTDDTSDDLVVEVREVIYTKGDNSVKTPACTVNTWITSLGSNGIVFHVASPDQSLDHLGPSSWSIYILLTTILTIVIVGLSVLAVVGTRESKIKSKTAHHGDTLDTPKTISSWPADMKSLHQRQTTEIHKQPHHQDLDTIDLKPGDTNTQTQGHSREHPHQPGDGTKQNVIKSCDAIAQRGQQIQDFTGGGKNFQKTHCHGEDQTKNVDDVTLTSLVEKEEVPMRQSLPLFDTGSQKEETRPTMDSHDLIQQRKSTTTSTPTTKSDNRMKTTAGAVTSPSTTNPTHSLSIKWPKPRPRLAAFLSFAFIVFVTVAVGVSRIKIKPSVHIMFPARSHYRHVRMFSDFPDLTMLSKNHTSLSLVSRLQLLDAQRCRDDPETCKISVVCDRATGQDVNCRCRTGFYFRDWKCRACSSQCPTGHYLASSCSSSSDAVCKACTICGASQYVAAPCNTKRDTICIDVSFPAGFLPMNRSSLPDDGIQVYVSHSSNVFVERLIDQHPLENSMYITNNQQVMEFVWDRLSSISISISVSGVFLVPEYHDVTAVDDTKLFNQWERHTQSAKNAYAYVQHNFCRHPVPDYYSLHLERTHPRTTAARVVRCDSTDPDIPQCPPNLKDGDRFLDWEINTPCSRYMANSKLEHLKDLPNSVVCRDETPMLRKLFHRYRPTTKEYMFPSIDCQMQRQTCQQCQDGQTCPNDTTMGMFGDEKACCGISCFNTESCKKAYSTQCPKPEVECAEGEVNMFSLFPDFTSMDHLFTCHLRYQPPKHLYKLTYTIHIPSLNYNSTGTTYTVGLNSRREHFKKLTRFDFLHVLHETGMPIEEDILLNGDHRELNPYRNSHMKPYTIRRFKTHEELNRLTEFQTDSSGNISYIQFERPFQYSSWSWYKDGCYKNMSRIFPNQTLYSDGFFPVEAKMAYQPVRPDVESKQHPGFAYQMYIRNKQPFVKLAISEGQSVLQFLQGRDVKGNLIPNSLHGEVTWHYESATWRIVLTGEQDKCPSVIGIKIFTQIMTGCAGHFDAFLDCPNQFTITFNFSTAVSDLPDIFVLQINDSTTSHRMVLSSMYSPLSVEESQSDGSKMVIEEKETTAEIHHDENFSSIWKPLLVIVAFALSLLFLMVIAYHCVNSYARRVDLAGSVAENESEKVALNNHSEKQNHVPVVAVQKPKTKWFVYVFVLLYILYSLVFSFTLTSGVIYLTYKSSVAEYSKPKHSVSELELQVNKSVQDIKNFETSERLRLFTAFDDRRQACMNHLEMENKKLLQDYQETTQKQINDVFTENGTLHQLTNQIQRQNVSMYMSQISEFLSDCNKTIHSIIDRFESNYLQFLKKSVMNDWLKVPRQIFLVQDGEDPDRKFLSSTQVKQFASWLEIDKVGALLAARDNMIHRLIQVTVPSVTSVDMTFPSLTLDLSSAIPEFQPDPHLYSMTVLKPKDDNKPDKEKKSSPSSSSSSSEAKSRRRRPRRQADNIPDNHNDDNNVDNGDKSHVDNGDNDNNGNSASFSFGLSGNIQPSDDFNNSTSYYYTDDKRVDDNVDGYEDNLDYDKNVNDYNYKDDDNDLNGNNAYSDNIDGENNEDDDDVDIKSDDEFITPDTDDDNDNYDEKPSKQQTSYSYTSNTGKLQDPNNNNNKVDDNDDDVWETLVDDILPHPHHHHPHHGSSSSSSSQNLIDDTETAVESPPLAASSSPTADRSTNDAESDYNDDNDDNKDDDENNGYLYILIGVFISMDVVLWLYRIAWLSNQLYAAKNGYADRIPTDEACKQVLEIQTAYHLPAFNGSLENTGTYVDGKEQLYGSEKERDNLTTFLQPLPNTKNDDILQQIWNEKTIQSEDRWAQRPLLARWFGMFKEVMQRFFLSQLVWQACVTFLAIIFICIVLYAVEFWLVPANLRTLVGSQSATSDIQWQLDTSGRYLHTLAGQLTQQLVRIRQLCEMEVAVMTQAFFSTINTQTSAFTVSLQRLCQESKGENCEQLNVYKPVEGRIISCNFLPLQAQTLHDLSLSNIEELVSSEVTPFLHLSKKVISTSSLFIVSMLCLRLICQVAATTVRHYLLLTGKLPRVKVYQSEEPSQMLGRVGVTGVSSSALQRSQSWVDSCESGVYVGEVEDGGGGGAAANGGGGANTIGVGGGGGMVTNKDDGSGVNGSTTKIVMASVNS